MRLSLGFILCFFQLLCQAQQPYRRGDVVANFTAANILNHPSASGSFRSLQKQITIIDFFGTWCAPCIRALPNLTSLQSKYPGQIAVVLISTEKETQLKKFIASRQEFAFPVIVDIDSKISDLFQPPAYPYTVVIDNSNHVIAITEAAEISEAVVTSWLSGKPLLPQALKSNPVPLANFQSSKMNTPGQGNNSYTSLSADFIYAAKTGSETQQLEKRLKDLNLDSLSSALSNDDNRKAFWINIYNGFTQLLLKKDPDNYKHRSAFFKAKQIAIGGNVFSLDQIEHDILRRSKIKWSLGYLSKLFPGKKVKSLRVDQVDYRIHFALNCGAKSCPPIAFYDAAKLNEQLDIASRAYLTGEAVYDSAKNSLQLPAIMGWFRHDFKGKKNMLRLVKRYTLVPQDKYPSITFRKYDWTLHLNNYTN